MAVIDAQEVIKNVFRTDFAKMVAVISRSFGLKHLGIAEDIVSETFLAASETWAKKGIPDNPSAWLYKVARQKALSLYRRDKIFANKIVPSLIASSEDKLQVLDPDFSDENIKDSQLKMLFAICNPVIASEAQIGLALRILCGFSIDEIADAFLVNKETVNKRLFRAKEKLRINNIDLDLPQENEILSRLDNVLHCIYLLFNEGYYSTTKSNRIRRDFCIESFRLAKMLIDNPKTNIPKTNALLALFCYHASRFNARQHDDSTLEKYYDQDRDLWDEELVNQGNYFFNLSTEGNELSSYHLEARIAFWHCKKDDSVEKWRKILDCYNQLILINYSPVVSLNRTYALYRVSGSDAAIRQAEKLNLVNNRSYHVLLGELYKDVNKSVAVTHLKSAISLSKLERDKQILQSNINALENVNG